MSGSSARKLLPEAPALQGADSVVDLIFEGEALLAWPRCYDSPE